MSGEKYIDKIFGIKSFGNFRHSVYSAFSCRYSVFGTFDIQSVRYSVIFDIQFFHPRPYSAFSLFHIQSFGIMPFHIQSFDIQSFHDQYDNRFKGTVAWYLWALFFLHKSMVPSHWISLPPKFFKFRTNEGWWKTLDLKIPWVCLFKFIKWKWNALLK